MPVFCTRGSVSAGAVRRGHARAQAGCDASTPARRAYAALGCQPTTSIGSRQDTRGSSVSHPGCTRDALQRPPAHRRLATLQTKEALERRRLERLEQDERMRKPWQQPPAPKKPILRKGAKSKPSQVRCASDWRGWGWLAFLQHACAPDLRFCRALSCSSAATDAISRRPAAKVSAGGEAEGAAAGPAGFHPPAAPGRRGAEGGGLRTASTIHHHTCRVDACV